MRMVSPGGGPPGNGEGVIFPCWKAAAVEEEKKIDITNPKNVLYAIYVYMQMCRDNTVLVHEMGFLWTFYAISGL